MTLASILEWHGHQWFDVDGRQGRGTQGLASILEWYGHQWFDVDGQQGRGTQGAEGGHGGNTPAVIALGESGVGHADQCQRCATS